MLALSSFSNRTDPFRSFDNDRSTPGFRDFSRNGVGANGREHDRDRSATGRDRAAVCPCGPGSKDERDKRKISSHNAHLVEAGILTICNCCNCTTAGRVENEPSGDNLAGKRKRQRHPRLCLRSSATCLTLQAIECSGDARKLSVSFNPQCEVQRHHEGIPDYTGSFLKLDSGDRPGCVRVEAFVWSQDPAPRRCGSSGYCWLGNVGRGRSSGTAPGAGGGQKQDWDTALEKFHPYKSAKMENNSPLRKAPERAVAYQAISL